VAATFSDCSILTRNCPPGAFLLFFLLAPALFRGCRSGFHLSIVIDDLDADNDALFAYGSGGARNQLFDFVLAFTAETAA